MAADGLVCPGCGAPHPADERFCSACALPLVSAGEAEPASEAQVRARKIDPGYAQGDLVRVAYTSNQAEAEMVQGLLLEEGIPSMLKRSGGFDVPDFLAGGPRDVLVPYSGAAPARDLLLSAELGPLAVGAAPPQEGGRLQHLTLAIAVLAGGFVTALVTWLLLDLAG